MGNTKGASFLSIFFLLCVMAVIVPSVVLERAKAWRNVEAIESAPRTPLLPSRHPFALHSIREHQQQDPVQQDEQQDQVQEHEQQDQVPEHEQLDQIQEHGRQEQAQEHEQQDQVPEHEQQDQVPEHEQQDQVDGHDQQEQQQGSQPDTPSEFPIKNVASSTDASNSFAGKSVNADEDVSCFPHDQNIGSRTHTVKRVDAESVQACLRECRKMATCTHYTYNKISKRCHMKESAPEFYTYDGDMTGPRSCDSSCFVSCLTYNTNPIKTLSYKNTAPQLCQAACAATKDCQAFIWTENDCKLFGSRSGAHPAINRGNTLAGPRELCEEGGDLRLHENGGKLGTCLLFDHTMSKTKSLRTPSPAADVAACQKQCLADERCTHYTYNKRDKLCHIKDGRLLYARAPDDFTGNRDCVPI